MSREEDSGISAYLETQGEEVSRQMVMEGKPVPGDSPSWRCGSAQSLSESAVTTSTPINFQKNSYLSLSNSSGRSSSGTTPPRAKLAAAKDSSNASPPPLVCDSSHGSERSRSSHSKSPKSESAPDHLDKTAADVDDNSFDMGASSEFYLVEDEGVFGPSTGAGAASTPGSAPPIPIPAPNVNSISTSSGQDSMKRSISHNSKLSSGGYYPSASSFNSAHSLEKTKKKKSWINNALNPTYRSRSEELRKNFPGLSAEEMLLGDYSCALQKDILVHGRIYVTNNFLCFYANIFKWETAVSIPWKEVTAMTKEKTALVIPNAILICSGTEKLFFCSFATRDKTHMMMFRVWQNALMDSPASQSDLWSWVQSCYGDKSNRVSDVDNDNMSIDGASNASYDGLETQPRPRLYSNIQEENEENKLAVNIGSFLPDSVGDKPMRPCNKSLESLPTDQSDNTESEPGDRTRRCAVTNSRDERVSEKGSCVRPGIYSTDILTYEVWRQSKDAREILNKNFKFNIDDLFTLLFTNSKFFYDFQAERKTFDIVQCPWQQAENSDEKFRKVEFTLNLNHAMGPKKSRATEVQTMRSNSLPGHIYSVDIETTNADIPYADYFYVSSHYCIVKVADDESRLTVLCDIKYKKSPWGLVKSFIEKNVWAGVEDHYSYLSVALDRESSMRQNERLKEQAPNHPNKKKTRRQRNRNSSLTEPGQLSTTSTSKKAVSPAPPHRTIKEVEPVNHRQNYILLCILCLLCVINVLLIYKIWILEHQITSKIDLFDNFEHVEKAGGGDPRTPEEWLLLLQKQEEQHNKDMQNWQNVVKSASRLLQQTENTMTSFSKSFQAETNRKLLQHFLQEQGYETMRGNSNIPRKTEL